MKHLIYPLFLVLFLSISSCGWYTDMPVSEPAVKLSAFFTPADSIYVAMGQDGLSRRYQSTETDVALGSGEAAMTTLFYYLQDNGFEKISHGDIVETEENALRTAAAKRARFLFYPKTNYWTDAFYLSCGNGYAGTVPYLDEADITLRIYNVEKKELIGDYHLRSTGCPVVILFPFGATTPESQLKKALDMWKSQPF